jgi:hypothetical protein
VHISYNSKDFKSTFAFKIDADNFNKKDFETTKDVAIKNKVNMTWFINVKNYSDAKKEVLSLKNDGFEVRSHGFRHCVYRSKKNNLKNLKKARIFLNKLGINANAFVAPFGIWNNNLASAMEKMNFLYSSEFSYDYDNLPSYPVIGNRQYKTLQIPIHPICIGRLVEGGNGGKEMRMYFKDIIDSKLDKNEPIFLYGHPQNRIGKFSGVIDYIFKYVKSLKGINITTFGDYAKWWKKKEKINYSVVLEKNKLKINTSNNSKDFYLRVILGDKEKLIPLKKGFYNIPKGILNKNFNKIPPDKQLHHKLNFSQKLYKFKTKLIMLILNEIEKVRWQK